MSRPVPHRLLNLALVVAGLLIGVSAVFAVFALNTSRDRQIERVQAQEAWARYDGQVATCSRGNAIRVLLNAQIPGVDLPVVRCHDATPRPTVPRPKEH